MAIQGAQPDHGRITPHLIVRNTAQAVAFYKKALGAVELYCAPLPDGTARRRKESVMTRWLLGPEKGGANGSRSSMQPGPRKWTTRPSLQC